MGTSSKVRDKDIEALKHLIPKAIERGNSLIEILNTNMNEYKLLTDGVDARKN
jgi:hypothetical protein